MRTHVALTLLTLTAAALAARAQAPTPLGLGAPGKLKAIEVAPGKAFELSGPDASRRLIVTGKYASGQERDLSAAVKIEVKPAGIVKVEADGLVLPLKEGEATLRLQADGASAETKVTVKDLVKEQPISFANQIVPVFTKNGCNSGGCHGKASGQNGFKLSLFGFEPTEDYDYLVKEARGRRLFPAAPDFSLLLLKASARTAHAGGRVLEYESPQYRLVRRWIMQGTPQGRPDDAVVSRIEVFPKARRLPLNGRQQLAVLAHFSDGSISDVTEVAQFDSNDKELATVSGTGLVETRKRAGLADVMVRFQTHVDVFRATVPLGVEVTQLPPAKNFIDELVFKQLKDLGLPPSKLADDGTFLRRATLDLAGRLPTLEETQQFRADKSADKYDKLVDRLLASEDYADYFASKWNSVLRNRRKSEKDDSGPTFAFHAWIRKSLHENKPYDQFVREVLTASGEEVKNPPVVWYREVNETEAQLEDTAQLFLGQRLGCARCHHHPFEKWSQEDYYGMAAFFSRLEVKDPPQPRKKKGQKKASPKPPLTVKHKSGNAQAVNPRTGQPVKPTGLGSKPFELGKDDDPRVRLVDWMTAPDNPFFARTLANRYWKHFMGRGLVHPEDDLRVTNPATHPELLDALAKHFRDSKFDMKKLIRTICTSRTYRLSALPNEYNAGDHQNFSRFAPRRLQAEVLLDAIDAVTLSKTTFKGVPNETRAVQLPDNQVASYFLSVFGRPDATSACECERSSDSSLAQSLAMFNSDFILKKVASGRASQLAKDNRPDEDKLRELYLVALSREPSDAEKTALLAHIERKGKDVAGAYADIFWALINTKEFLFNH